jgi:hypothetical protein
MRRPRPEAGHAAIFGDPTKATAESGNAFIAAVVDALAETFKLNGVPQLASKGRDHALQLKHSWSSEL